MAGKSARGRRGNCHRRVIDARIGRKDCGAWRALAGRNSAPDALPDPRPREYVHAMTAPKRDRGRAARLAAALKANLKRRKTQARGRADETRTDTAPAMLPADRRPEPKSGQER